jgi:hypothetical protein
LLLSDAQSVGVSNGLYVAKIGAGSLTAGAESTLSGVFKNRSAVHLEVSVNGETLSPRVQIVSAGYALLAGNAQSLTLASGAQSGYVLTSDALGNGSWQPPSGGGAGGGWTDDGAIVRLTTAGDKVGIGTASPAGKLQIEGAGIITTQILSTDSAASLEIARGASTSSADLTFETGLDSPAWQVSFRPSSQNDRFEIARYAPAYTPYFDITTAGDVGIGTTSPAAKLDVAGAILASGTITSNSGFSGSGSGLTGLNASNLASGTVADARLSANVSLLGSAIDLNTAETAGVLPVAKGGTGSSTQNFVDLSNAQTVGGAKTFSANGTFSGLLGVGASPAAKLTVYTTASVDGISLDGTTNPAMIFKTNGVTRGFIGLATTSGAYSPGATANSDLIYRTEAGKFLFSTNGGGATTMTITNGAPGSVVIGGTSAGTVNNTPLFETQQSGGATDWWRVGRLLNTNMSTGKHTLLMVGRSDGQGAGGKGNAAQIGFYYAGDGSASNRAWFGVSWSDYMYMDGAGNLVLNGASANGYKPGGGSWAATSDARLKKNVRTLDGALDRLLQLRGVAFEWNEAGLKRELCRDESTQTGFVAQEVEKVFPEWITTMPDGYKAVGVKGFEALAVESLRELKRENDALKGQVSELIDRISALERAAGRSNDASAAGR